jgi:hypothetical protein
MDTDGPYRNGSGGDHMRMAAVGKHDMSVLRTHMRLEFLGPHAMGLLGTKYNAICRDYIRLSILWTTCHGNSEDHTFGNSGVHIPWQFWGKLSMALFRPTCDGSCGDHKRMADFWETRAISILWTTRDVIAGEHTRWKFLGQYGVPFLGTMSYTGVKLKSLPSGVRIMNCHTFSCRA